MKSKLFVSFLLVVLSFTLLSAQDAKLTEKDYLEQIAAEQARLDKANADHDACKAVGEPLMQEVEALRLQKEQLANELAALKESRSFYTVKPGDWLSKLADYKEVYGRGGWKRWPEIYKANKKLIKDPNLIYPNWKLTIPRP
ncbi:MAG: LysM peptidoglycan-binding domain-containing protein [bacterium]|nr:LysM peptidoglycan-binding domain-containing protein [bacterium]